MFNKKIIIKKKVGYMDKTKGGWKQGKEVGLAGVEGSGGG